MDKFLSLKIQEYLNNACKFNVYKIIGSYMDSHKLYMAFIYFKTEKELKAFSEEELSQIKESIVGFLKNKNYIPDEITETIFYFDSDENVQKNYKGNYFYATR